MRKKPDLTALAQFRTEPKLTLHRRNGWINEDETQKIGYYFYAGLPPEQIAQKFSCSLPTVYSHAQCSVA